MTNHPTKTSGLLSIPQSDQVVGDPDKSPVCLDSVPGTHKDLAKSEMLLDVLVKGFDPDPLKVKCDHLRLGHLEVVGHKEPDTVLLGSGNKQKYGADLGHMDLELGHAEASFFGSADRFVFPRSLGQMTERNFLSVDFHKTVSFDRYQKSPCGLDDHTENRRAGVPSIHQDRRFDGQGLDRFGEDIDGQLNFALEGPGLAGSLGAVAPDRPKETPGPDLENTCDGTKSLDEAIGSVMNAKALDLLSLSRAGGIVEDQKRILFGAGRSYLAAIFALKFCDFLWRCGQKLVKAIGVFPAILRSNLPDRAKLHEPDQSDEIDQQIDPLRLGDGSQEIDETRRNFPGNIRSHGFRALLGLVSKGDFGRKPFYLKRLSLVFT